MMYTSYLKITVLVESFYELKDNLIQQLRILLQLQQLVLSILQFLVAFLLLKQQNISMNLLILKLEELMVEF